MQPKVFISYSWSSSEHQMRVKSWAEQLISNGVDVILDIYDLKEGHDKFAFMERMVTDKSVTHVLVICDKRYSEKADGREAGVGTESQIISKEVYDKVDQAKFIPIVAEFSDDGKPFLPIFLQSRIWIDFSSVEAVNDNWETLVRVLYGKPLHEKPKIGTAPLYITSNISTPITSAFTKFNMLKIAVLEDKKGLPLYRQEFIKECVDYIDLLRTRERPDVENLAKKIIEDCSKLKIARNYIIDWVSLESSVRPSDQFNEALSDFLEQLLSLKTAPPELNSWSDAWYESHALFVYETFIYIVASLLKSGALKILHDVLTSHYLMPEKYKNSVDSFTDFKRFHATSEILQSELAPEGRRLYSPAAELIKIQSDRSDLPLSSLIEADLLIFVMALIKDDGWWYPQLQYYAQYSQDYPLFIRAIQHKGFMKLAQIVGFSDAALLRGAVEKGLVRLRVSEWSDFRFVRSFQEMLKLDKLDTIK